MGSNLPFFIYMLLFLTNSNLSRINITYAQNLGNQKDSNYNITLGAAIIMIFK